MLKANELASFLEPPMFIQTEQTPNPATLKFLPGCMVMASGTANFTDPRGASRSPLAERLFTLPEVSGVFLGGDFITVTKAGDIIFEDFADGVVYLHMQGSCSGCPSSTATLKAGIENMLRHYIPEVVEVRAV